MAMLLAFTVLFLSAPISTTPVRSSWEDTVRVIAKTGSYTGVVDEVAPDVRQFRNIPFSLPPIGERRWLPPIAVPSNVETKYDSTRFPPSCPQYAPYNGSSSVYIAIVPEFVAAPTKADQYAKTSEDCLSLALWTPTAAGKESKLPVAVFMTGGGFGSGGIDIPYQFPHHWVQRTQRHIVVTINYRVNIFGFPHAAGLDHQNLGILDQRLALEWVRDNIDAFGGDPDHITLWGQSAGAASADIHNYAYADDPIVTSFFMDSGSVSIVPPTLDTAYTNFTFVARHFGCDTSTPEAELSCMRAIEFQAITEFVGGYGENKTFSEPNLSFWPTSDEHIVFSNYTDRLVKGLSSGLPALFTSCKDEGAGWGPAIVSLPSPSNPYGIWKVNDTITVQGTLGPFQCPAAKWSALRDATGLKTYRWQYSGNFTNVSPLPWMGAYHTADLPMLFGSHADFRGPSTPLETATSESMQDHLLAFMKDPVAGPEAIGWADNKSGGFLRFGANGIAVAAIEKGEVDGLCTQ